MEQTKRHLLTEEVEQLRQQGLEFDEILWRLRERGCSKTLSVAVIAGLREFGPQLLSQAKRLVHESPVWGDAKEHDESIFN
jgi:hypothetical protein